ncbi:DNA phosphorothioation system sulfurtransferase DndC [Helicobacter monodelphidis]|uniref:DNA phosphorothioation system sulfurtransferase DndC n=1 Tax=Helicobacter sp. 15-1451 TaxID=2004995 RepID=UPI00215C4B23|nr:DNA phosphorothioation system sulfurtransferase DndC [Helicobacter sp. 15-1451]
MVAHTIEDIKSKYLSSKRAFVVAFSGGKDSTCVLQLVYEMLVSLPQEQRRPTFAIASNTLVEAPHIERFLQSVITSINKHARENGIPFEVIEVAPESKDEFWVNLIGKGYPSPTRTFRWCTDRLKITPTKSTIANITHKFGSVLLCLGTRKQESTNRKKSMEKRVLNEDGYSQHHEFPNTLTYSPIAQWSTDDVWGYLIGNKPLWDKDHSELFALYSKASGDECQFITDLRQSSCGGSRFGCWVCTVVNEDKSLQGFIGNGESHLKPLNEFRNFIKDLRENPQSRADYKRDGRAVYKVGGLGPFLSSTRIEILHRLLEAEKDFKNNGGDNLISDSQILAIQEEWDKDFDFNDTAINLAKEYNRMEKYEVKTQSNILHKEILEEIIANDSENLGLDSQKVENVIAKSIEIFNDNGKTNANRKIKQEIEKILDDKTSKSQF